MMDGKPTRVIVADDHALFRQCLCEMLKLRGFEVAGEAAEVAEVLELCNAARPDILLLDVQFADGNGLSVLPELFTSHPDLPVLIISGYYDLKLVEKALSLGIRGYLPKHATLEEVESAIKRIAAGDKVLHGQIFEEMIELYEKQMHNGNNKQGRLLNDEDISILRLCSEGKSYGEISRSLFMAERTLYRKLNLIFEKLNVANRMQAVSAALKKGLL